MGNIYRNCSRTIIYLGADIILPTHDRFSRRERLHRLATSAVLPRLPEACNFVQKSAGLLQDILKRRYFSRVWIIQELILSQQTVFRVGDVDFCIDHSVKKKLFA